MLDGFAVAAAKTDIRYRQMLMGTTVSAFEQPILAGAPPAAPAGVCTGKGMDYSPLSQPCQNDFAKTGLYSKDNTVSRMEVNREV